MVALDTFNDNLVHCLETYPKTLQNVEKHLSREKSLSERLEDCEESLHLTRAPPAKLTNIMISDVYGEKAFPIKNIEKLAKAYECEHCHSRFTKGDHLQRQIFLPRLQTL